MPEPLIREPHRQRSPSYGYSGNRACVDQSDPARAQRPHWDAKPRLMTSDDSLDSFQRWKVDAPGRGAAVSDRKMGNGREPNSRHAPSTNPTLVVISDPARSL